MRVQGEGARFKLTPGDEITQFFVLTARALSPGPASPPPHLDARVLAKKFDRSSHSRPHALATASTRTGGLTHPAAAAAASTAGKLQLMQPLLGYEEYEVRVLRSHTRAFARARA